MVRASRIIIDSRARKNNDNEEETKVGVIFCAGGRKVVLPSVLGGGKWTRRSIISGGDCALSGYEEHTIRISLPINHVCSLTKLSNREEDTTGTSLLAKLVWFLTASSMTISSSQRSKVGRVGFVIGGGEPWFTSSTKNISKKREKSVCEGKRKKKEMNGRKY